MWECSINTSISTAPSIMFSDQMAIGWNILFQPNLSPLVAPQANSMLRVKKGHIPWSRTVKYILLRVKEDNILWSRAIRDLVEVKERFSNDQVAAPHMLHLLQCLETKWLKAELFLLRYILALSPYLHQQTTCWGWMKATVILMD